MKLLKKLLNEFSNNNKILLKLKLRHVHLSRQEIDALFGPGYQLTKVKDLSQPGQFVCKNELRLLDPKDFFQNVVILGS